MTERRHDKLMRQKITTTFILSAAASLVSACNSTDSLYSQGPWGPSHVRRNYPEYTAPWGYRGGETISSTLVSPSPDHLEIVEPPIPQVVVGVREPAIEAGETSSRFVFKPEPAPIMDQVPDIVTSAGRPLHSPREASASSQTSPPGVFTAPQRASSYSGTWKATVGASSCRVQLSSAPSLDLYKASAQGCSHDALRSVNGWTFRDNQIVLFSRGQVVARLSGAEAALTGTLSSSGTELTMSR
jgi:hypothetical protein